MTSGRPLLAIVARQVSALQRRHPGLALTCDGSGRLVVGGALRFAMRHDGRTVEDEFHIELRVRPDYPASPPDVYEVGGRLDRFHHLFSDGRLCLGAPVEVRMRFAEGPSLMCFIEDLVTPFLFAFSYHASYGMMPFGELAHGAEGLLEYYSRFFETPAERTVWLLKRLTGDGRDPSKNPMCPCESGRKLKRCHGQRLDALRSHQTTEESEDVLKAIVSGSRSIGNRRRPLLPRHLRRKLGKWVMHNGNKVVPMQCQAVSGRSIKTGGMVASNQAILAH